MKRSDIPLLALALRHLGELLVHPCSCGRDSCVLGEHVWRSTQDMVSGPPAANTDPTRRGWRYDTIDHVDGTQELMPVALGDSTGESALGSDPVDSKYAEYVSQLNAIHHRTQDLNRFLQAHRPDRRIPTADPPSDNEHCRHHLATIGTCEPRAVGDLCDFCRSYQTQTRKLPPADLLQAKHEGRNRDFAKLLTAKPDKKKTRKKARR